MPTNLAKEFLKKMIKRFGCVLLEEQEHALDKVYLELNRLNDLNEQIFQHVENVYHSLFVHDTWLSSAKNMHKGERCFILATGPSLNKVDLSKIQDEITFGVNGTYKIEDLNMTYFVYVSLWYYQHHIEGIKTVKCQRRFLPSIFQELASDVPTSWLNVHYPNYYSRAGMKELVPKSFSFNPGQYIIAGGTVLFLCLQLAYYMGFKEVILLGVDHSYGKDDEKAKQHGGTEIRASENSNAHFDSNYVPKNIRYHLDLDAMERGYELAKNVFAANNRVILNASPGTKLRTFPVVHYDQLF